MEKIIMIVGRSKDLYGAYSDNCDEIYAAGESIEAVKADTEKAIQLIKKNLPKSDGQHRLRAIMNLNGSLDLILPFDTN